MQVFLAVARAGRVSAAARRLQVEHTTVSRRLAALETELGVPLFYRASTGYLLTPHGESILPNAEAMEQAALGVAGRARERSGAVAGRVRVALPPEFASHWLAPRAAALRQEHPQLDLQILVGTRQRDLSRGEAELAIQPLLPRQQGLVAVRLGRTSTALYVSKKLAGSRRMRVTSADTLRGFPLLCYSSLFPLLQGAKWFQPLLASARIALESNSTHALLAAARAGAGVAVLPRLVARDYADLMLVSENVGDQEVWLITHPDFRRDPRVRAAGDFLKRIASNLV